MNYLDLCGPDPNPMTRREAEALMALCHELPRNPVIVQLGAERGASTLAMLERRPDAFILSVDCGPRPEEFDNLKLAELEHKRVVRVLGYSQDVGFAWPWPCDLLYIDGDHRRPGIDQDIEMWAPTVREGGVIALHDYIAPEDRGPQIHGRVWEAVNEATELEGLERIAWVGRLIAFRQK